MTERRYELRDNNNPHLRGQRFHSRYLAIKALQSQRIQDKDTERWTLIDRVTKLEEE